MGKDLKNKELGVGLSQREDGYYVGRFTNKSGRRVQKVFRKLKDCRQWLADAKYRDEHSNIYVAEEISPTKPIPSTARSWRLPTLNSTPPTSPRKSGRRLSSTMPT